MEKFYTFWRPYTAPSLTRLLLTGSYECFHVRKSLEVSYSAAKTQPSFSLADKIQVPEMGRRAAVPLGFCSGQGTSGPPSGILTFRAGCSSASAARCLNGTLKKNKTSMWHWLQDGRGDFEEELDNFFTQQYFSQIHTGAKFSHSHRADQLYWKQWKPALVLKCHLGALHEVPKLTVGEALQNL